MPVLDKVKEAENQAETCKVKAKEEVDQMLEAVAKENSEIVQSKMEQAKKQIENLNQDAKMQMLALEKKNADECQSINQQDEKIAQSHLDETIDFILKKVIDS